MTSLTGKKMDAIHPVMRYVYEDLLFKFDGYQLDQQLRDIEDLTP